MLLIFLYCFSKNNLKPINTIINNTKKIDIDINK